MLKSSYQNWYWGELLLYFATSLALNIFSPVQVCQNICKYLKYCKFLSWHSTAKWIQHCFVSFLPVTVVVLAVLGCRKWLQRLVIKLRICRSILSGIHHQFVQVDYLQKVNHDILLWQHAVIGLTLWACQVHIKSCTPALTWSTNSMTANMSSLLASWSRILSRKQSVMFIVNLFQLGEQVGPRGQTGLWLSVPNMDYIHFNDNSVSSRVNTKHLLNNRGNYQFRMKQSPLIHTNSCDAFFYCVHSGSLNRFDLAARRLLNENVRSTKSKNITSF